MEEKRVRWCDRWVAITLWKWCGRWGQPFSYYGNCFDISHVIVIINNAAVSLVNIVLCRQVVGGLELVQYEVNASIWTFENNLYTQYCIRVHSSYQTVLFCSVLFFSRPWFESCPRHGRTWKSQSEWQRTWIKFWESTFMMWPTLGSRTATEWIRTIIWHLTLRQMNQSINDADPLAGFKWR